MSRTKQITLSSNNTVIRQVLGEEFGDTQTGAIRVRRGVGYIAMKSLAA